MKFFSAATLLSLSATMAGSTASAQKVGLRGGLKGKDIVPKLQRPKKNDAKIVDAMKNKATRALDGHDCVDSPEGWYDAEGPQYNCEFYATFTQEGYGHTACYHWGDGYANFGKTANEACCTCGGGQQVGEEPIISPTPAPTPSTEPIFIENELADEWLSAHNTRREAFHTNNEFRNRTYVPLKWSQDVATSAQEYADLLIAESNRLGFCFADHEFNGNEYGGENLSSSYADYHAPTSPEEVLWGWFEDEEDMEPYYTHRTQVIWAGTQYVGCAQSSTTFPTGEWTYCQITVCRYIAPGNCGDGLLQYNKEAVYDLALRDNTGCGPHCPAEGCF